MKIRAFVVTTEPLDLNGLTELVADSFAPTEVNAGAITAFIGTVRNENQKRRVDYLEYEAFEPLAVKVFENIAREVSDHWPQARLAVHHRLGKLQIGEASVAIAAASPHRNEAFAACRYAIERIKQIAPIWKHEFFSGGDVWVEGATADPDDNEARQHALERSCV